jgi:Domain of unknown function (DUF4157)
VQRHGASAAFAVEAGQLGLASGSGRPLPDAVRGRMEAALSADFSAVRVHVGPQAERIGAIAFTIGSDIYFAPGRYQPDTIQGQQLLGHELAHVVQQRAGRVRAQHTGGVMVVQDTLLEAEAERLGLRAALHQAPPRTAGVHARQTGSRGAQALAVGSKPAFVQRTIYKWNDKKKKWYVSQVGTRGAFPKPNDGSKGKYFNDINGLSGDKIANVRAGLTDLMMVTGGLNQLGKKLLSKERPTFWPADLWSDLMTLPGQLNFLGRITLTGAGRYTVQPYANAPAKAGDILERLWDKVLKPFMKLNGQLGYIQRQEWFRQQSADVMIEINFYKNRDYSTRLGFHKDTEGDNLFVNLLFNNASKIPATEWIEDLAPSDAKLADMKKLMPDSMEEGIARSRTKIREGKYKLANQGTVRGGKASTAAFVSWTDELVWHATPSVESRLVRNILWRAATRNAKLVHDVALINALSKLKSIPGTQIDKDFKEWRRNNRKTDEGKFYTDYINQNLGGVKKKKIHQQDIKKYFRDQLYAYEHHSPAVGIETDEPLFGTASTTEKDAKTGIEVGISRRNSVTKISLSKVDMGPRAFLRTWVRVVRKDVAYGAPKIDVQEITSQGAF